MKPLRSLGSVLLSIALALVVADHGLAQAPPKTGGVFKAAMIGEPPSLDLHTTTAAITQQITWHMYETLYTYDKASRPIPMLAEALAVNEFALWNVWLDR